MRRNARCTNVGYGQWGLIPLLIFGVILSGCGKKTMPRPLSAEVPPQIQDLSAQVAGQEVELSWSLPGGDLDAIKKSGYQFAVSRSDLKWENRDCAECPVPSEQRILTLDPAYPQGAVMAAGRVTWRDASVAPFNAYRYQVAMLDARGQSLVLSNTAVARVVPSPAALKNAKATPGPQGILLQWREVKRDVKGKALKGDVQYLVERTNKEDQWENLAPVPIRGNSFLDSALASSQSYHYRITPVLMFEGTSVRGEPAVLSGITAPEALPPPPPATVWAIPSKGALEVQWTESEGHNAGYHVYRREDKEIIRLTSTPVKHPPFLDRNVKPNVVYGYAVSAVSHPPEQKEGLLSKWAEIRNVAF